MMIIFFVCLCLLISDNFDMLIMTIQDFFSYVYPRTDQWILYQSITLIKMISKPLTTWYHFDIISSNKKSSSNTFLNSISIWYQIDIISFINSCIFRQVVLKFCWVDITLISFKAIKKSRKKLKKFLNKIKNWSKGGCIFQWIT